MFTWEEAGLLRQMFIVVAWIALAMVLAGVALVEREPIGAAVRAGLHRIQSGIHTLKSSEIAVTGSSHG